MIACITMLIDHVAILLMMTVGARGEYDIAGLYETLRIIGRIAFPLYCFLLVEGFVHTKNIKKYVVSMGILAAISEPIYQLYFNEDFRMMELIDITRNVCITFTIGLIMMAALKYIEDKANNQFIKWSLYIVIVAVSCFIVHAAKVDYDIGGMVLIATLYVLRKERYMRLIVGYLLLVCFYPGELFSIPAFAIMALYNGERGVNLGRFKYLFYVFYPAHILLLYIIRSVIWSL